MQRTGLEEILLAYDITWPSSLPFPSDGIGIILLGLD
jgi:hypothetical protein